MRIALLGATGQLGTALTGRLDGEVVQLRHHASIDIADASGQRIGTFHPEGGTAHATTDIADATAVAAALDAAEPQFVINASAYNFVDKAEDEPERAYAVNALGPRNLASWCARRDVPLLHVSTDYVFGLEGARHAPYAERDAPGPLSAYAVSKLSGESFVRALCPKHFVVRTCGLYGRAQSPGKGNFIETMLRLGKERGRVSVVDDQWCTPTSAVDLAQSLLELMKTQAYGLYHATNSGTTTWCRLAAEVFRVAGLNVELLPITTAEYPTKARRPPYSVLDSSKLATVIGRELPSWQTAVGEYLQQRGADGRG